MKMDDRSPSPYYNQDTQSKIIIAEKIYTDETFFNNKLSATTVKISKIAPKMAPVNLNSPKEHLEESIYPDQRGYNPYQDTKAYSYPYCPLEAVLLGVPDCFTSCNPLLQAPPSHQGDFYRSDN